MEDVDESSSENNIKVIGIISYIPSIHQMKKLAYQIFLIKDSGSPDYRSRIGFNLGSLPIGYYTFVCEFFPPVMTNVSLTALGTTISINNQTTKTFSTYMKTLVQFHRWNSTPPQYIYLDLHGPTPDTSPTALAFIVVYGVQGYYPNVPSSVFDQVYVVDNGRMVMQTDLDLHGYRLMNDNKGGLSFDSGVISLHDNLNTNGYSIIGRNGGGFELDNNGRIKMHGSLDLNGHSIYETLNFLSGDIVILKKINMNNQKIINVANGTNDNDVVNKKQMEDNLKYMVYGELKINQNLFMLNGSNEIIMPYRTITSVFLVYKTYNSTPNLQTLPAIGIKMKAGNTINVRSSSTGISQQINVNQTMTQSLLSVELVNGPLNQSGLSVDQIYLLIELAYHN